MKGKGSSTTSSSCKQREQNEGTAEMHFVAIDIGRHRARLMDGASHTPGKEATRSGKRSQCEVGGKRLVSRPSQGVKIT